MNRNRSPLLLLSLLISAGAIVAAVFWIGGRDQLEDVGIADVSSRFLPPGEDDPESPSAAPDRRRELAAQGEDAPPSNPQKRQKDRVRVCGRVVDVTSRRPIVGARVSDPRAIDSPAGATTSADGTFTAWCRLAGDGAALLVTHPGYASRTRAIGRSSVGPDGVRGIAIGLWPRSSAATLEGRVVDPSGRGLRRAVIEFALQDRYERNASAGSVLVGSVSIGSVSIGGPEHIDPKGRFALRKLSPGTYRLTVRCAGFVSHTRAEIALAPRGTVQLGTVELSPQVVAQLRGRVTESGRPCAGAELELEVHPGRLLRTVSDADGQFVFREVVPGVRRLSARWRSIEFRESVRCEDRVTRRDIELAVGDSFVGGTVVARGVPVPGVEVRCDPPDEFHSANEMGGRLTWIGRTDAEGRFRIDHIPGGPVELTLTKSTPYETSEFDGVVIDRSDHRFEMRGPLPETEVSGHVLDGAGEPVAGAVISTHQRSSLARTTRSLEDGSFRFVVQPERDMSFLVTAQHPGFVEGTAHMTPRTARAEGCHLDFVLHPVAETGEVAGRITGADGEGVPTARVILWTERSDGRARWVLKTDSLGHYLQRGVLSGEVHVLVNHEGYTQRQAQGVVTAGARLGLDLRLSRELRLTRQIEVSRSDGSPAHGVAVRVWHMEGSLIVGGVTDQGVCTLRGLPAGPVRVTCEGSGHPRLRVTHTIRDGARAATLRLRLRRGEGVVRGIARDSSGELRSGVEVHVRETATEATGNGMRVEASFVTGVAGTFEFADLPIGRYELSCYPGPKRVPLTVSGTPTVVPVRIE